MDILERSWKIQRKIEERAGRVGKGKYGRVLKMARKPDSEEYMKTLSICLIGILLIGGIGFLIYWLFTNIPNYLSVYL